MFSLFDSHGEIIVEKRDLIVKDVVFRKDFGPFRKGERCDIIKMIYDPYIIQDLTANGEIIRSQQVYLLPVSNRLEEIINWMDDDNNTEHLYTKEGKKVYRFYSGTTIDRFLRELYEETR